MRLPHSMAIAVSDMGYFLTGLAIFVGIVALFTAVLLGGYRFGARRRWRSRTQREVLALQKTSAALGLDALSDEQIAAEIEAARWAREQNAAAVAQAAGVVLGDFAADVTDTVADVVTSSTHDGDYDFWSDDE